MSTSHTYPDPAFMATVCWHAAAPPASLWRRLRAWYCGAFDRLAVRQERLRLRDRFPCASWTLRNELAICSIVREWHVLPVRGIEAVYEDRLRQCEQAHWPEE